MKHIYTFELFESEDRIKEVKITSEFFPKGEGFAYFYDGALYGIVYAMDDGQWSNWWIADDNVNTAEDVIKMLSTVKSDEGTSGVESSFEKAKSELLNYFPEI